MFFCKRSCDYEKDCLKCSRIFLKTDVVLNYLIDYHFNKMYVSNLKSSPEMSNFFFLNNIFKFKLDTNNQYIDLVRPKENRCMFFDACNNSQTICDIYFFNFDAYFSK